MRLALTKPGLKLISAAITGDDAKAALATTQALANAQSPNGEPILLNAAKHDKKPLALRAPRSTAWPSLRPARLRSSRLQRPGNWEPTSTLPPATPCAVFVGRKSARLRPALPRTAGLGQALPPLAKLVAMKGDIANGEKVFFRPQSAWPPAIKSARESILDPSFPASVPSLARIVSLHPRAKRRHFVCTRHGCSIEKRR